MTLPRLRALQATWKTQPPAPMALALIAQALGWKPGPPATSSAAPAAPRRKRSRADMLGELGGMPGVHVMP